MPDTPESLAAIAVQPPELDLDAVAAAVSEQFALSGELAPLVSERDQNFRLTTTDGRRFVAKIASRADSAELIDFQVAALKHLEQQGLNRVPRVVDTVAGASLGKIQGQDGADLVLRVVTWVDGEVRRGAELSVAAAQHFGASIAEFDDAIAGFSHPGENQRLLWDMRRAAELTPLVAHIDDAALHDDVLLALESFADHAAARLKELPQQVIHNDLNGGNVLFAQDKLVGIIDFGDMLRAPRIIDVAIAAAYLRDTMQPVRLVAPLLAGYMRQSPLNDIEKAIFFDLVRARLCATVAMLYWRMSERPVDDPYRQKTITEESGAGAFLAALNRLGRKRFEREVMPD